MKIDVIDRSFSPWAALQAYEAELQAMHGRCGAVATFVGTMRDFNEGDTVKQMFLEHYPGMTENMLKNISQQALSQWDILDTLIIHRVGQITPGESIVLVAAWSSHRGEAFAACRFLIEELKHHAPFWKHETLPDGSRWVERNTVATA